MWWALLDRGESIVPLMLTAALQCRCNAHFQNRMKLRDVCNFPLQLGPLEKYPALSYFKMDIFLIQPCCLGVMQKRLVSACVVLPNKIINDRRSL